MIDDESRLRGVSAWLAYAGLAACSLGVVPLHMALVAGLMVALITRYPSGLRLTSANRLWLVPLIAFLAVRVAATFASGDPAVSLRHLAKDWRFLALLWTAGGVLAAPNRARWLPVVSACLAALFALSQVQGIDLSAWGLPPPPHYKYRVSGLLGHSMTSGGVALLLLFGIWMTPLSRPACAAVAACSAFLVAVTAQRSVWGAALVAVVIAGFWSRRRLPVLLVMLVFMTAMAIYPRTLKRAENAVEAFIHGEFGSRPVLWRAALEMGSDSVLGVGPGRFRAGLRARDLPSDASHAHNAALNVLAETGWPGLAVWSSMMLSVGVALFRAAVPSRPWALATLAAFLAAGLFENNFYDGEVAVLFFLLMGHALWLAGAGLSPGPGGEQHQSWQRVSHGGPA